MKTISISIVILGGMLFGGCTSQQPFPQLYDGCLNSYSAMEHQQCANNMAYDQYIVPKRYQ